MKQLILVGLVIAANSQTLFSQRADGKAFAMTSLSLNGAWQVSAADTNDWFAATVPGCIHTDLLAAQRIPDPFYRDNEIKVQWIGEKAWTYRRAFEVAPDFLQHRHILLRCEGLDTLATVLVNGVELGQADNMFRAWEFDAKSALKPGVNCIEVRFASVLPLMRAREAERHLPTWDYPGSAYVRKMPCNFGWDWGPTLITCGIWKNISLVAFDVARLDDVQILQDHSQPGKVGLRLQVNAAPAVTAALQARVSVITPAGKTIQPVVIDLNRQNGSADVDIRQPQLWWPAGMGAQPLYTVKVELLDAAGTVLDATQKRIGLRTMKVLEQTKSTPMQFVVNGVPFFAKGANWIPADAFPTRLTKETLRRYMADAAACNMNTLRFWGGGYYEDDALFDACDELGLCIWMDFKFACSTYPVFDTNFLASVQQEAEENVKRLRHHPSIALWCGNNEIMFLRGGNMWDDKKMSATDYYKLFRDTLGGVMSGTAPQTTYVTGSPDCGDVHYWDVWHGGKPFEDYRKIHGFISEFGFQAFAVPATVNAFTAPEDRTNVYAPAVKHHERSGGSYLGNSDGGTSGTDKIMKIVQTYFRPPKDFESTLWLSQINQAYGIEYATEGWRREMPRSMGCVFWQYNDDWPCTSWSSVDYFGRWKALQYRAKHFYSPVLVSGVFHPATQQVELWLTSDALQPVNGKLNWRVTDLDGQELRKGKRTVMQAAQKSSVIGSLDLTDLVQQHGAANLLVWLTFDGGGPLASDNVVMLVRPKELALRDPGVSCTVSGSGTNYEVTVRARHPALWVWLDIPGVEARFSDNFVHLAPGSAVQINVQLSQAMTKNDLVKAMQAHSLFSTFAGVPTRDPNLPVKTANPATKKTSFVNPSWWFTKQDQPIIRPSAAIEFDCPISKKPVAWLHDGAMNPSAVVKDGKVCMIFRGNDNNNKRDYWGTSRLGLAQSEDGIKFNILPHPVLYPDEDAFKASEWIGGCEDPRVVKGEDGKYYMTYTATDGMNQRLFVASSSDLVHWNKHGFAFGKAYGGKYTKLWCKSAAIITRLVGDEFIATKINGKYWMYWGEADIYLAWSKNMIDWTPLECPDDKTRPPLEFLPGFERRKAAGLERLIPVLRPREGMFDSNLVEPGPQAMLTGQGILFIYNSKNDGKAGDPLIKRGAYCPGFAIFDANDPGHLLRRSDMPLIVADKDFELKGHYPNVVFAQGLVQFKRKLYLYYGCADSFVGVAIAPLELEQFVALLVRAAELTPLWQIGKADTTFKLADDGDGITEE